MNMTEMSKTSSHQEPESHQDSPFNLYLPAGVAFLGIGLLTLITPLFTRLTPHEFRIDMISGGVLALMGAYALLRHSKSRRRPG